MTEAGQTGSTGVHVNVITVLEQEHGTELDLVPTLLRLVMAGAQYAYTLFVIKRSYHIQISYTGKKSFLLELHELLGK